jgi:glycosyltransferase involved in cell wall biosynthesis
MNLVLLTPGAGAMFCGGCMRDNALAAALRKLGHEVTMVPLYLPLTLDEADQSAGTPIFFGGISVYLQQHFALFRQAPSWFLGLLTAPRLLKWAGTQTARTRPSELGEMTLSMLQGEHGNQARELDQLLAWLKTQPRPDAVCLSNGLLAGMVHRLKSELGVPVIISLQGEDSFLDGLPDSHRSLCWQTLSRRAAEADVFISPSRYYAELMARRLELPAERIRVVWNGIALEGYERTTTRTPATAAPPVIGYFARMCPEKGLETLVEAYIRLRETRRIKGVRLRIGGSCGSADEGFVASLRKRLEAAGVLAEVEFCPNLDRSGKLGFLKSLTVFSVPAHYGEAFGLYVLEAMAAGVPVVQPQSGAFPELLQASGGGILCAPEDSQALADALESLLTDPERAHALGEAGKRAAFGTFSAETMARNFLSACFPAQGN